MEPNNNDSYSVVIGEHTVSSCYIHIIFVTKYRRAVFTNSLLTDCETVMKEVCERFNCEVVEFNGEKDHVRLLVRFPLNVQLSDLVKHLTRTTVRQLRKQHSRHIRKYLWGDHFWSRSYYISTVGGAPLEVLKQYVLNQKRPT